MLENSCDTCGMCRDFLPRKESSIPGKIEGGCADRATGVITTYDDSTPPEVGCFKEVPQTPRTNRYQDKLDEYEHHKNK